MCVSAREEIRFPSVPDRPLQHLSVLNLAFSLPALLTGFLAPIVGLVLAADLYGAAVILMAVASLIAIRVARRAAVC